MRCIFLLHVRFHIEQSKTHLPAVFDILFYAAESQVLLTKAAAEECLAALSQFLGKFIFR